MTQDAGLEIFLNFRVFFFSFFVIFCLKHYFYCYYFFNFFIFVVVVVVGADIYHCVFGDLEESLQSCCWRALETASAEKLGTVVFWLDGFISLSGELPYGQAWHMHNIEILIWLLQAA